jgi:hypothetical protein
MQYAVTASCDPTFSSSSQSNAYQLVSSFPIAAQPR